MVTATGMGTEMGQIATMLSSISRTRSPLQKELGSLTKVLGVIAWTAVAFISAITGASAGIGFAVPVDTIARLVPQRFAMLPDPSTLTDGVFATPEDLDTPHHK